MPVRTWGARLRARLRGSAGVNQSAMVAGLVAAALGVSVAVVPFGPRIGGAVADLFVCELGQGTGGRCTTDQPAAADRRVLLDGADPAQPPWYQPAYNSTVYTGPPPATVPETSGAGGTRPVDGTPTSMDWCTPSSDSSKSTFGSPNGWTSTQFWTSSNYCVDPSGQLRSCTITHLQKWFNFIPLGTTDNDIGCSAASIPAGSMACTSAGLNPPQWTCQIRGDTTGRMFHCTTAAVGLSCTDTNHDTERALTGAPISCTDNSLTRGLPGDLGQACLGADGTLYACDQEGLGSGTLPAEDGCPSRALSPGTAGLSDCTPVDGGAGVQCTYLGIDPACVDGPQCPVQRTTVQCAVSQADGKYNHCQDTGGLVPPYLGDGSVCEARAADGTCTTTTAVPLYGTGPVDHVTAVDDLSLSVSPDLVQRGQVPNPITGTTSSYADAVAACTGHEVACRNQVVSDLGDTEATLAKMMEKLGFCTTDQECVNPNSVNGRKLLQWYRSPMALTVAWAAGSMVLLTGLNSAQFMVSNVHYALAGGVGAGIFVLMLTLDKLKTRLTNRLWPATAAVDVAALNAAVRAATASLQQQVDDLVTRNLVNRATLGAQIADLENQLAQLQPQGN